ncbi:MAG: hypothetical protein PHD91_07580 [bacterium]|jgi:hypothetical protein|nr:hypothetical protein [bacterium]MDD3804793.1 hypothetical protein [bacterium]MDD4153559.1 hypothetical protein [bacterium]MDD4558147.1 hypothetical protein [bacterium]
MNNNKKLLLKQMQTKIYRLERELRELNKLYIGMLMQYDRTTAFKDKRENLEHRIRDLKSRLDRIKG